MRNQIIRFCMVGILGTIIDVSLLYFFVEKLEFPIILSNSLSFGITMSISFLIHKNWTFKNTNSSPIKQFLTYSLVSLIGLGISNLVLYALITGGLWYLYAKIITVFIVIFWSFSANKFFTFVPRERIELS